MRRLYLLNWAVCGLFTAGAAQAAALNDYDGLDYAQSAIHGLNGGTGWNGAYVDTDGDYGACLTNDGISLSSSAFPFTPVGSRLSVGLGEVVRPMSAASSIVTNAEGNALYISFLMRKTNMDTATGDYMEVDVQVASGTRQLRVGISEDDKFYIGNSTAQYAMKAGAAVKDETYYVVLRFLTHAGSTPDEISANVYGPGDTVPLAEPTSWLLTTTAAYNSAPVNFRVETGGAATPLFAEFDEFRTGNAWVGTAVPEPTTLGVLVLGGLMAARRRRAA